MLTAEQQESGATRTRDIVVIGASMGGMHALTQLAASLPRDLPAAVLVVQHTAPSSPALIADILSRRGGIPAVTARDGMQLERGLMIVASPDRHLLVTRNGVQLSYGARENHSRPSIDPTLRTAAVLYGARVVGVILTGLLDDGAAGLLAVHRCGGHAIVQSPDDAEFPEMPLAALQAVPDAVAVPLGELARVLSCICRETAPPSPPVPDVLRMEVDLTLHQTESEDWHQLPGSVTPYTCPECNGSLKLIDEGGIKRFRCRVGHVYSYRRMLHEKVHSVEESLWVAMQTLEERARMLDTAAAEEGVGREAASSFAAKAQATRVHVTRLRELLESMPQ